VSTSSSTTGANQAAGAKSAICPHFHAAIELIGKRWSGAILSTLGEGPKRFAEIGQAVPGMSDRLLSERLRELESEGLVVRAVEHETQVRVTYSLSEKGGDLTPVLGELRSWARRWKS